MELLTNTVLFFSIAFMILYLLGWVLTFVAFWRMEPFQRHYTRIEVSVAGMLGFILSVCYNVAYWMR